MEETNQTTFRDAMGRKWECALTVASLDDVKKHAGFELDALIKNPEAFADMIVGDPRKLVAVLFGVCQAQCAERKVDASDFGRGFNRSTLEQAVEALLFAVVDFFPRRSVGRVLTEHLPQLLANLDKQMSEATRTQLLKNATA